MARLLINFGMFTVMVFLTVTKTDVIGQKPPQPLVTILGIFQTTIDVQIQILSEPGGRHTYTDCVGHLVHIKYRSEDKLRFRNGEIVEKRGGFLLQKLEPGTQYDLRVACKTDYPISIGEWSDQLPFKTLPDDGNGASGISATMSMILLSISVLLLMFS